VQAIDCAACFSCFARTRMLHGKFGMKNNKL
jgi:hypothetical protein